MSESKKEFHGIWWVPSGQHFYPRERIQGTLTYYGDRPSELQIFHEPSQGVIAQLDHSIPVIYGQDAEGNIITLFNAVALMSQNFSFTTFVVRFVLLGCHTPTLHTPFFDSCIIKYPYLINWVQKQRWAFGVNEEQNTTITLDSTSRDSIAEVELETGELHYLWGELSTHYTKTTLTSKQCTNYCIECSERKSIQHYIDSALEFSQLLSIALFSKQSPSEILLSNKNDRRKFRLLFTIENSVDSKHALIKTDAISKSISSLLIEWHKNYTKLAPISTYLIRSLQIDGPFDAPDFLIVAQALDGYYKRFFNKKDATDTRQYRHQIDKLLKHFKVIEALQRCNIDSECLAHTRHKYSHLIPDDDPKITKAVDGNSLYWLTQKCKVLLTCCILEILGLSMNDINNCCNHFPISLIVHSLPFE